MYITRGIRFQAMNNDPLVHALIENGGIAEVTVDHATLEASSTVSVIRVMDIMDSAFVPSRSYLAKKALTEIVKYVVKFCSQSPDHAVYLVFPHDSMPAKTLVQVRPAINNMLTLKGSYVAADRRIASICNYFSHAIPSTLAVFLHNAIVSTEPARDGGKRELVMIGEIPHTSYGVSFPCSGSGTIMESVALICATHGQHTCVTVIGLFDSVVPWTIMLYGLLAQNSRADFYVTSPHLISPPFDESENGAPDTDDESQAADNIELHTRITMSTRKLFLALARSTRIGDIRCGQALGLRYFATMKILAMYGERFHVDGDLEFSVLGLCRSLSSLDGASIVSAAIAAMPTTEELHTHTNIDLNLVSSCSVDVGAKLSHTVKVLIAWVLETSAYDLRESEFNVFNTAPFYLMQKHAQSSK